MTMTRRNHVVSTAASRVPAAALAARPAFETLEGRTLFAAAPAAVTVAEVNAMVEITGTRRADEITLSLSVTDSNLVDVVSAGVVIHTFDKSLVAGISVSVGGGNDRVTCDAGLGLSMLVTLMGGNGNDILTGSDEANHLIGGNGKDTLWGGAGADHLWGNNGKDLLDGGLDDDILEGGNGRDFLCGGLGIDVFLGRDKLAELADYVSGVDEYTNPFAIIDLIDDVLDVLPWPF